MHGLEECFRWYGPRDPVPLNHIRQAGATGIVSALHDIYDGTSWPAEAIASYKAGIEKAGLTWSVVESIPVHNSIKIAGPERTRYAGWYKDTIRNLAAEGVKTICYNFMPVVDWTRTDLLYPMPSTGLALRFDAVDFAAYDLFVLKRSHAEADYSPAQIGAARQRFASHSEDAMLTIERNLIAGLPATERSYNRAAFKAALADYAGIGPDDLRANLIWFHKEIIPVAEEVGARMCIHPDDPPFPLYGLPRVVSTVTDLRALFSSVPSRSNGLTFCVGSLGSRPDNDLPAMLREFAPRIHFSHLRNVTLEDDGSFVEADHLGGSSDMPALIIGLMQEQQRRQQEGRADWHIPIRPDHGHLLADDIGKTRINPGYSLIGRLKGLAEIRGVMHGAAAMKRMQ